MSVKMVPAKFIKHLEGDLYEIRVSYEGMSYRIFSCFDEGNKVVLLNAFVKKTQGTPLDEKEKARRLMNQYFQEKNEEADETNAD